MSCTLLDEFLPIIFYSLYVDAFSVNLWIKKSLSAGNRSLENL